MGDGAIDKDRGILELLGRLDLASRGWQIVDHWEADLCAIGIAAARDLTRLVYVSTFAQAPGCFAFECETPAGSGEGYTTAATGEGVDYEELLSAMTEHLDRDGRGPDDRPSAGGGP